MVIYEISFNEGEDNFAQTLLVELRSKFTCSCRFVTRRHMCFQC